MWMNNRDMTVLGSHKSLILVQNQITSDFQLDSKEIRVTAIAGEKIKISR